MHKLFSIRFDIFSKGKNKFTEKGKVLHALPNSKRSRSHPLSVRLRLNESHDIQKGKKEGKGLGGINLEIWKFG